MPDFLPDIIVVVDDAEAPAPKRRRLIAPDDESPAREAAQEPPESACTPQPSSESASFGGREEIGEDTLVCFGMILDLPVTLSSETASSTTCTQGTLRFHPPRALCREASGEQLGCLGNYGGEILLRLNADDQLTLQLALSPSPAITTTDKKACKGDTQYLGVILYGPRHRFSDVGDFISRSGCYLDDPIGCDRNVPYMNPQCLFSLHEQPPMTFDLLQPQNQQIEDFTRAPHDVLADFETTTSLQRTAKPTALRTDLKPHQREALTFLLRREQGLHPSEDGFGIWSRRTNGNDDYFVNVITNETLHMPGPLWRGGLLADEMGLGKTLSMIALVASDQDRSSMVAEGRTSAAELCCTLIVLPLSLLHVWESQLKSHVYEGRLTWFIHHGKQRFRLEDGKSPPDIVFTTYQTVERESRKPRLGADTLISHRWRRIILDEAHIVRNHNTSTARAVTALNAASRWAISGTPIQNNLVDFLGLLKFLQFVPYDDPKVFDDEISELWRSRPIDEAVDTLKKLLSSFMLRRTKAILDLPKREDKIQHIAFSEEEEKYYRSIEQPVVDMLDRTSTDSNRGGTPWMTTIQLINKLRLVCNLGKYVPSQQSSFTQLGGPDHESAVMAARISMGGENCSQCMQPIELLGSGIEFQDKQTSNVYYSACNHFYCPDCSSLLHYRSPDPCDCMGVLRPCHLRSMVSSLPTPRLTPIEDHSPSPAGRDRDDSISSKVKALASQIQSCAQEKHVVFSSWTSSLDMVERALRSELSCTVQSVRIDGKVPLDKRSHAIRQFHNDPTTRVILVTIGCGACGLDLTAASRVHLLEPQWNPSLEDQALARIHRLGQTRPVTTIRYIMTNSFEEHILKVQDRKKLLASTLLSSGSSLEVSYAS
ncbi:SNF2 family N-terminal domain-containing protein [Paraphoma chrysanthemicola]|nr:SNF2 family N-terminal domain-containing protein [Paraphoma chrysanthemicola]